MLPPLSPPPPPPPSLKPPLLFSLYLRASFPPVFSSLSLLSLFSYSSLPLLFPLFPAKALSELAMSLASVAAKPAARTLNQHLLKLFFLYLDPKRLGA